MLLCENTNEGSEGAVYALNKIFEWVTIHILSLSVCVHLLTHFL